MKVKVRQIRSSARSGKIIGRTMHALGLGRIGKEKTFTIENNDALKGMIKSVGHLVEVTESK